MRERKRVAVVSDDRIEGEEYWATLKSSQRALVPSVEDVVVSITVPIASAETAGRMNVSPDDGRYGRGLNWLYYESIEFTSYRGQWCRSVEVRSSPIPSLRRLTYNI